MKEVIILFLVAKSLLVSGNPLTQIIPTLQTCPHVCNQNTYQNTCQTPNNFQLPNYQNQNNLNIPVLLQQQNPTQQIPIIQQNTVPTILQQPTNNNQLYPQQLLLQNQLTAPIPHNQITNPVANQLSQIYMNKILSNPTIQTFLDQNSNTLYHTGLEYPQYINNIPNVFQNPEKPPTPTVVNNYFLLPPELLNTDKEYLKPHRRPNEPKRSREGPKRRSQEYFEGGRRPNHDAENANPDIKRKHVKNPDCPVHSKKKSHKRSELLIAEEEHRHSIEEKDRTNKRRRPIERNHDRQRERNISPDYPKPIQRIHPERPNGDIPRHHEMPKHHETPKHHEMPKHHQQEMKRPNIIIKIKERPKQSSSEIVSPVGNSKEKSTEVMNHPRRGKMARPSRDDEIIEDFKKKFPAIPEEVIRKLLLYLRRQIHKQQLGHPPFYYPDVRFPLRYDQLFPHSFIYDLYDRNDRRRVPNRRPKKKEQKFNTSSNFNIETTTNIDSVISTTPTTTERSFIEDREEETEVMNDDQVTTPKHGLETTTTNNFPELGTEDTIPDISNGIIDDYFPDFTQDKAYFESGEAFNIRNLRDNRYHYTTDRNYETKRIHNTNNNKSFNIIAKDLDDEIEEVLSKPFDTKIETSSSKYEIETEIQFRTPPSLESPDFKTKQIVRHKPNPNDKNLSYKSSTYSDAKNPSKTDSKNHKIGNKKVKPDNIQTVYAHSKVVKYGKVSDENDENVTPVVTYYLPDNMQYEDDGKTVIVAKRIPADHFW